MNLWAEIDARTLETQAIASDPATSAWVAANAGSGKTFVLSRRVIRLLLSGVDPGRILCLTFTKAAAAEMAKRVFAELSAWTRLADADLAVKIAAIEGRPPDGALLSRARRLFARALDTPGGLKIQTIHAFCERLLHQFPFEANIAGHFEVLDERGQAALTIEARRAVLARAAAEPDGVLGSALQTVLDLVSDFTHEISIAEIVAKRDQIRAWTVAADGLAPALRQLRQRLGLAADETAERLRRQMAEDPALSREEAQELAALLRRSSVSDQDAAGRLDEYVVASDPDLAAVAYLNFYRTEGGDFRVNTVTKTFLRTQPGLDDRLAAEVVRLTELLDRLRTAELYESTAAMFRLADATIDEYERRKRQRAFLDFEDLVVRSVALLSRSDASRWVQYKLDRGIDHILIDEAQDTSPRQWQVIRALAGEFFAGEGASPTIRSIFAVGDEKQSIFSFQGAVPAWFADVRREFSAVATAGGYAFAERELHLSFRSVPVILEAVDAVFAPPAAHAGLTAESGPTQHDARRRKQPGRVIVWPVIRPPDRPETQDWATPVDHLAADSPEAQLADRIARTIRGWLDRSETLDAPDEKGNARPIRPGEILILVRSRGALTDAINRQLKTLAVPIAGADRLALTEHIAVMDLCALGRVVLTPEDDLSLAALLKSPLVGLDEDALFTLAHDRGRRTLWTALTEKATERADLAGAKRRIDGWRTMADVRDPHAFFARVLAGDHGRQALLARLGPEALDVLDEFMAETLRYEETNTPSLEGFLAWLVESETEIKRDTDTLRDEVRVMTVHGAKGLEADVVFLVDNGMPPALPQHDPRLLPLDDGDDPERPVPLVWNRSITKMPREVRARVEAWRGKSEEEYRRLLYVGMTRARDRLYVVGIDKKPAKKDEAAGTAKEGKPDMRWHALMRRALAGECVPCPDETGEALEWHAEARSTVAPGIVAPPAERIDLPGWAGRPVAPAKPMLRLTPSTVADAENEEPGPFVAWRGAREARERGRIIHRLLQSLPDVPPAERAAAGARYLAAHGIDDGSLLPEVLAILADPGFAEVFGPGSRAEIDIVGTVETAAGPAEIAGRIDRLAVTPTRVLVVDYKTNRPAPKRIEDAPTAYIAQLALYRIVLRRLYRERIVAAAILWTDVPALMTVPAAALDAAETAIFRAGQARSA